MNLRIVKTWFLEHWSSIFRSKNQSALALFWKFLLGHFIFGYKNVFLSNQSNFLFQIILKVSLIGFLARIKDGAQNGAPEQQFYIDWKKFNFNFAQILRVFLAAGLQGLQKRLHLCMKVVIWKRDPRGIFFKTKYFHD